MGDRRGRTGSTGVDGCTRAPVPLPGSRVFSALHGVAGGSVEERERSFAAECAGVPCETESSKRAEFFAAMVERHPCATLVFAATEPRARRTRATFIADERQSDAANSIRVIKFSNTRVRCRTAVRFCTVRSCFNSPVHASVAQRQYIIARAAFVGGLSAISRVKISMISE